MANRAAFKQIDVTRLFKAALAAGLQPTGCEVVDGRLRLILVAGSTDTGNSADRVLGL